MVSATHNFLADYSDVGKDAAAWPQGVCVGGWGGSGGALTALGASAPL